MNSRIRMAIAATTSTLVIAGPFVAIAALSPVANASGATVSTSTQTETMTSAKCYHTHKVTVTTYYYSSKTGWTKYAAPKRTVTDSTTCH